MADAVATRVIEQTATHYIAHFTNISDGTGESAVVKVDKSALTNATDGAEAGSLDIEKVVWCCDGMQVRILWDHTADDLALALSGSGSLDFKGDRNTIPGKSNMGGLKDPRSTGGTGDILFTTNGHTAGDTYNITLFLRKNPE
jgi:hypothetical protein